MIVPIHNDNADSPPEWAMLELNGELVAPTHSPSKENEENHNKLIGENRVELGAVKFTKEVRQKTSCFVVHCTVCQYLFFYYFASLVLGLRANLS